MKRSRVAWYGVHRTIVGRPVPPCRGRYTSAEIAMPSRIGTRWSCRSRTSGSDTGGMLERLGDRGPREMAGGKVPGALGLGRRLDPGADRAREPATRAETAPAPRGVWGPHGPPEDKTALPA